MLTGTLDAVSNKAAWPESLNTWEVIDDETEEGLDLSNCVIVFEVRDPHSKTTQLSATIANGKITVIDTGVFKVSFTATDMRTLCFGTYEVGCTITNGSEEPQQYIIGALPVIDGVVT